MALNATWQPLYKPPKGPCVTHTCKPSNKVSTHPQATCRILSTPRIPSPDAKIIILYPEFLFYLNLIKVSLFFSNGDSKLIN